MAGREMYTILMFCKILAFNHYAVLKISSISKFLHHICVPLHLGETVALCPQGTGVNLGKSLTGSRTMACEYKFFVGIGPHYFVLIGAVTSPFRLV